MGSIPRRIYIYSHFTDFDLIQGYLNDGWHFHLANRTWTWITGSKEVNTPGVYGEQWETRVMPGGRQHSTLIMDTTGRFFLLGGLGLGAEGSSGTFSRP